MEKNNRNEQPYIPQRETLDTMHDPVSMTLRFSEEFLKDEDRRIVSAALALEGYILDTQICSMAIQGFDADGQSVKGSYFETMSTEQREKIASALLDVIHIVDLAEKRKKAKALAALFT